MTPPPTTDLDFAAIRQQYPAAFACLIAWFTADKAFLYTPTHKSPGPETIFPGNPGAWLDTESGLSLGDTRYEYVLHPRALYDFFDQQGVCVSVSGRLTRRTPLRFSSIIITKGPIANDFAGYHSTRAAAETAAFTAAFGKLEELLN